MPFDTALSGIRAASNDLSVTGNNIANASTTGFKGSRVEFGDVYATSVLGSGSNAIGSGVQVQDVSQRFVQGNVTFTDQALDMAINGNGFFVLNNGGEILYSRAGSFGLNQEGFIVNNTDERLQGFSADDDGNIGGISGDIQIETSNLSPRRTTSVSSVLNIDASEPVLQTVGRRFETEGNEVGVTRAGRINATTTEQFGGVFTLPLANDFNTTDISFELQLSAASGNNGTVNINLGTADGVPAQVNSFNDLRTLASVINAQIFSPTAPGQTPVDVVANAVDLGGGNYRIDFQALVEGEPSQIGIDFQSGNADQIGLNVGALPPGVPGVPAVSNGYPAQAIDITDPDGLTRTFNTPAGASAAATAASLNRVQGVSATAVTEATLSNFNSLAGDMQVILNGSLLASDNLSEMAVEINSLTNSSLPGVSAVLDPTGTSLTITSAGGEDITIAIASVNDGDNLTVTGDPEAGSQVIEADFNNDGVTAGNSNATTEQIVVGGSLEVTLDENYEISNPNPVIGLFQPLGDSSDPLNPIFERVTLNEFDPNDQATYNHATSLTLFDSLGNSHIMTQFFVKQSFDPDDVLSQRNHWEMFVQVDGQDVGDPDTSLPPPDNTLPTQNGYDLFFNEDGSLNELLTPEMLVSNWTPVDADGNLTQAAGPQNVLAGGAVPIPDPPSSSNFAISFDGTTQFGSEFSVNDVDQNGFTTGRLSGLNIDRDGIIFARFTNGESQVLGQVALADFRNQEGLQPAGNSRWVENFESGPPNIAAANTGALGTIQSSALEESNVDLSAELVKLIIAQRNYQANAKTIETANAVTQTIINLR
ncbi:MAG: ribonuclease III [Alteromonadaceae bacterium]|nr:MAG: ribonuclease III [Alteromonadaceae bacterium]